jgi:hypothetical protein
LKRTKFGLALARASLRCVSTRSCLSSSFFSSRKSRLTNFNASSYRSRLRKLLLKGENKDSKKTKQILVVQRDQPRLDALACASDLKKSDLRKPCILPRSRTLHPHDSFFKGPLTLASVDEGRSVMPQRTRSPPASSRGWCFSQTRKGHINERVAAFQKARF